MVGTPPPTGNKAVGNAVVYLPGQTLLLWFSLVSGRKWLSFRIISTQSQFPDLPDSGIKARSPALQADSLPSEPPRKPPLNTCKWMHPACPHTHMYACVLFLFLFSVKPKFSSVQFSHSIIYDSLWPHGWQPARLLCPRDYPGKNTGVGCHFLLQRIFPTQRSNSCLPQLLQWQVDAILLSHLGSSWCTVQLKKKKI